MILLSYYTINKTENRSNLMENWIIDIVNNYGYIGIFLLIAIENIFPPIPSEVILTLGGFMTTSTSLTIPGVVLVYNRVNCRGYNIIWDWLVNGCKPVGKNCRKMGAYSSFD